MTARSRRLWRRMYEALEEAMGMLLPILALASISPGLVSLPVVAFCALWFGFGHTLLYYFGVYPALHYRGFLRGLIAFGAGVCWPLWLLAHSTSKR